MLFEIGGDFLDQPVPNVVSIGVVDAFETVEVHHGERQRLARLQVGFKRLFQSATVGQVAEAIDQGLMTERPDRRQAAPGHQQCD